MVNVIGRQKLVFGGNSGNSGNSGSYLLGANLFN